MRTHVIHFLMRRIVNTGNNVGLSLLLFFCEDFFCVKKMLEARSLIIGLFVTFVTPTQTHRLRHKTIRKWIIEGRYCRP